MTGTSKETGEKTQTQTPEAQMAQFNDLMQKSNTRESYGIVRRVRL